MLQRQAVGGIGMRAAAEGVTRKLVEQDQQGQCIFGTFHPVRILAASGCKVLLAEMLAEVGIERIVVREPAGRAGQFPESQHHIGLFVAL